jgi:biopolymer transport protein ExbD
METDEKTMSMKRINALNMIPFIDIMLVLLVIVLMTSSFIASGRIPVNLPNAKGDPAVNIEPAQIALTAEGRIFLDTEEITLAALPDRLSGKEKETAFLLRADREAKVQDFIGIVDALKRLGFTKVAVETRTTP